MIIITEKVRRAIARAAEGYGGQSEFARQTGTTQQAISKYISGVIGKMSERTWRDLYPHIKQYLPADSNLSVPGGTVQAKPSGEGGDMRTARHDVALPTGEGAMLKVPVIGFAAAAMANPALMPIAEFANENADDYQAFPLAQPGDFCLVVSGDSMLPWYPEGTRLLCRACRPGRGQRVVAVLGSGEVVFKVFVEKDDKFCLFSINEDGEDFVFSKTDYGAVRAIYSIIESIRDEQAIDKAMRSSGIRHRWEERLKSI